VSRARVILPPGSAPRGNQDFPALVLEIAEWRGWFFEDGYLCTPNGDRLSPLAVQATVFYRQMHGVRLLMSVPWEVRPQEGAIVLLDQAPIEVPAERVEASSAAWSRGMARASLLTHATPQPVAVPNAR